MSTKKRGKNSTSSRRFRSGFEATIASSLESRRIVFQYEALKLEYVKRIRSGFCLSCGFPASVGQERTYTPDFLLVDTGVIVETKGKFTPSDRAKMLQIKDAYPELDIRMVFQYNNKLSKRVNKRYSDWCDEHEFIYAVGDVPTKWGKND